MRAGADTQRCYQFVGYKEGEHKTHIDETTKLGWLREPFDVENGITKPPRYLSHRLIVEDGHSDWLAACWPVVGGFAPSLTPTNRD